MRREPWRHAVSTQGGARRRREEEARGAGGGGAGEPTLRLMRMDPRHPPPASNQIVSWDESREVVPMLLGSSM